MELNSREFDRIGGRVEVKTRTVVRSGSDQRKRRVRVDGSRGKEAPANGRYRAALGEWLVPRSGRSWNEWRRTRDSESGVRDIQNRILKRIIAQSSIVVSVLRSSGSGSEKGKGMDKEMEAQRRMTMTTQCRAVFPIVVLFPGKYTPMKLVVLVINIAIALRDIAMYCTLY